MSILINFECNRFDITEFTQNKNWHIWVFYGIFARNEKKCFRTTISLEIFNIYDICLNTRIRLRNVIEIIIRISFH